LTSYFSNQDRMSTDIFSFEELLHLGESATHPIEPPWGTLATLLLLAGMSLLPRRALPALPMTAHSGAFNYRSQV